MLDFSAERNNTVKTGHIRDTLASGMTSDKSFADKIWVPSLVFASCIGLFWACGLQFFNGFQLLLGSVWLPTGSFALFALLLVTFAAPAAVALAMALSHATNRPWAARLSTEWASIKDSEVMVLGSLLGVLIPLAIRSAVLNGAVVTDDESAYRFSAEILSTFRLTVPSHASKLFFDNAFIVNDGQMYSQYPLGWPMLLTPGVWLGVPSLVNPLYSGATVPALFLIMRRLANSHWARLGILLYLTSVLLMGCAATLLSQTSSSCAFAWAAWCCLRSRDDAAPRWVDALFGLFIAIGFFIRPMTAVGLGAPLVVSWAWGVWQRPKSSQLGAALAFGVPAAVLGGLFLWVNKTQTGHAGLTAYVRYLRYTVENQGRFAPWPLAGAKAAAVPNLEFQSIMGALAKLAAVLVRLNFDALGWPVSLLFVPFARKHAGVIFSSFAFFMAGFLFYDPGVDTFGPNHAVEAAIPLIVMSGVGAKALARWFDQTVPASASFAPMLVPSLAVVALLTYVPVRLLTLNRLSDDINAPSDAIEGAKLSNAVVFTVRPWANVCRNPGNRHFVFFRPNNDPDFKNSVLLANHLTIEKDRELMSTEFSGREGYLLLPMRSCDYQVVPLSEADQFPPSADAQPKQ